MIAYALETSGELAFGAARFESAARLLGAAAELFAAIGVELSGTEREGYDRTLAALEEPLGGAEVAALVALGRELDLADAIREALDVWLEARRGPAVRPVCRVRLRFRPRMRA